MSDAQLAAILSAVTVVAGILGAAVRWSAKRIIRALDANSDSNIALTQRMAEFTLRMEDMTRFVEEHTPVNQPIPKPRRQTPPQGSMYMHVRQRSKSDTDE